MQGTHLYAPPEWLEVGEYRGEQATVWSLGVLAFVMLQVGDTSKCHVSSCWCVVIIIRMIMLMLQGDLPFPSVKDIVAGSYRFRKNCSAGKYKI